MPTLSNELIHIQKHTTNLLYRKRDLSVREVCSRSSELCLKVSAHSCLDNCRMSIFGASWLCSFCGQDLCSLCFKDVGVFFLYFLLFYWMNVSRVMLRITLASRSHPATMSLWFRVHASPKMTFFALLRIWRKCQSRRRNTSPRGTSYLAQKRHQPIQVLLENFLSLFDNPGELGTSPSPIWKVKVCSFVPCRIRTSLHHLVSGLATNG